MFDSIEPFDVRSRGFAPLFSFAAGGLAEAWTGGSYPFNDGELEAFPFGQRELEPYYGQVAERIGISGADDDLAAFYPLHDGLQEPLELDRHSQMLLDTYARKKSKLQGRYGWHMGRARIAALSAALGDRPACSYLGRCLWGCPTGAFYTPSLTLQQCQRFPGFDYVPGIRACHFTTDDGGRVTALHGHALRDGSAFSIPTSTLALAAGTLCTAQIVLESIARAGGSCPTLSGIMDNRQVLMPFVNLKLIGQPFAAASYQYHQVAIGVDAGGPMDYVHGLVTTLKTAQIHPVVQTIPGSLGIALSMFRNIHTALGLVNINFSDQARPNNTLELERDRDGRGRLHIRYQPPPGEAERIARTNRLFRRALMALGCVAPPPMTRTRPMGASVHYAGSFPMTAETGGDWTTDPFGRLRAFDNLYLVDGSTFPSLPAKNLTFTLMANAARIADAAC